jgi:hypothetical protein
MPAVNELLTRQKLFQWTYVDSETDVMAVPKGWIIRTKATGSGEVFVAQTFVPDVRP